MNKKTYVKPAASMVQVAVAEMICTSGPQVNGTTDDVNELLSRELPSQRSVWDDEEEDY